MAERQPFYKYIVASLFLATCLEFSRFFEFKLTPNNSMYITTCMAENPYYVQYNSYWNEIFATGLVPLILLCYMNLKIFQKIKVSAYLLSWMKKKREQPRFFFAFPNGKRILVVPELNLILIEIDMQSGMPNVILQPVFWLLFTRQDRTDRFSMYTVM